MPSIRPTPSSKLALVAVAGLAAALSPLAAAEATLLRFKPSGAEPPIYEQRSSSTTRMQTTTGEAKTTYGSTKTLRRSTSDAGGGQLAVRVEDAGGTFEVNGHPVAEKQPERPSVAAMTITSTGQLLAGALSIQGKSGGIDFVLPDWPVAIGDSWKSTVPAREDFPIPVEVTFKLRDLKKAQGRLFAIVSSNVSVKQPLPERHVVVVLTHQGSTAFDVAGGHITQAGYVTTYKLRYLKANVGRLVETETASKITLNLAKQQR